MSKLSEIFVRIEEREKLAKKFRRIGNTILITDTGLIIITVITGSTSIAAFASGVAIPVGIALTSASMFLSIVATVTRKSHSGENVKLNQKRRLHYKLKLNLRVFKTSPQRL